MEVEKQYQQWLQSVQEPELLDELKTMTSSAKAEAFYKDLEFGTGGLRGVLGAGTNRMNVHTVKKATQGLCDYLKTVSQHASVAIAYDSRIKSDVFARAAASVIAANGLTAHLFAELMPTPVLSYAVRSLKCDAGIVVTASHNPAKYNGYKVYGNDGCQITLDMANAVLSKIETVDIFEDIKSCEFSDGIEQGLIQYIDDRLLENFLKEVQTYSVNPTVFEKANLQVVYTPLNGTGNKPVRSILAASGLKNLHIVPEQEQPDGRFPTCKSPNPEERSAFEKALEFGRKVDADLLLATDPDCDRVGIAVKDHDGGYALMTGNETGCLLLDYILSQRQALGTLPTSPVVIKTIVTSALANTIAKAYGAQIIDTLTGFKFIGEQIGLLEQKGETDRYVFGFEESYGYLPGGYVRDKDAVAAAMLICEMASYYQLQNKTLLEALQSLYEKYGCYRHKLISFEFDGVDGMDKMKKIMTHIRQNGELSFAGLKALRTDDYLLSLTTNLATGDRQALYLPKSDVLVIALETGCEIVVRPSGTEPKLKAYLTASAKDARSADEILVEIEKSVREFIH